MSLGINDFESFFVSLYGYAPFPWQSRLARQVYDDGWPDCMDLPTASGKTAAIDIAVFALACQAHLPAENRRAGRRIFFAVNRRVIVDEAFDRAKNLAQRLLDAPDGVLKAVADALRSINENGGDRDTPPLDVAQLRGGIYRDTAWARSITQPIVVCTTADQLGSRLLFRGYGVSDSMKPVHAALCGCDSLVLLDEAHVTRAFSQTMQRLPQYQSLHASAPRLTFVQMTATPADEVNRRFGLNDDDRKNAVLADRQHASKPAALVKLDKKKSIIDEIIKRAIESVSDARKAIGIIVNRVQTARQIEAGIAERVNKGLDADVHLVIGRMRPLDRDDLQRQLRAKVGPDRPEQLDRPFFVVATQCLEVGADYDFDALITECGSIDALRQRFGRLNRRGRRNQGGTPLDPIAAIVTNDESIKGDDPIYGDALKRTWEWLWSKKNDSDQVDFGIAAFGPLWQEVEREHETYLDRHCPKPLLAPASDAAVLLPAHLDALCQTAPQPVPSPDVSYFIHGPQRDNAEVNVCWRADLGENPDQWPEIVRLLPPTSPECMTVPLRDVRRWMKGETKTDRDADVPVQEAEADAKSSNGQNGLPERRGVVIWRGSKKVAATADPGNLRPGDTVVIRTEDLDGWESLGHIPGAPPSEKVKHSNLEPDSQQRSDRRRLVQKVDVAEQATALTRRRFVVRVHADLAHNDPILLEHVMSENGTLRNPQIRSRILAGRTDEPSDNRLRSHDYPTRLRNRRGMLVELTGLTPKADDLQLPVTDEDDEDDNLSELDRFVSLSKHTQHVVERLDSALNVLRMGVLNQTVRASAPHHDTGKADTRFQAMLAGITPSEAMERPVLLGKGDGQRRTQAENEVIRQRAMLPKGFRHEMLSVQIVEHYFDQLVGDDKIDHDLLLHLIAAHHGRARPFAPIVVDESADEQLLSLQANHILIDSASRKSWTGAHRLDSPIAERFWQLTRRHGWWGLAYLESILRLADQQASAAEQEGKCK